MAILSNGSTGRMAEDGLGEPNATTSLGRQVRPKGARQGSADNDYNLTRTSYLPVHASLMHKPTPEVWDQTLSIQRGFCPRTPEGLSAKPGMRSNEPESDGDSMDCDAACDGMRL